MAKAAPLTDLFKDRPQVWSRACEKAFVGLKRVVTEEPVLNLPDHTKAFEIHNDASDFAIGGVLVQEGHIVTYKSRKLNKTEQRYTV